jgi:hypothetical protein
VLACDDGAGVEDAQEEDVEALMKKIDAASFDYEDFMKQNEMISKMGSMRSMVKMMPGAPPLHPLLPLFPFPLLRRSTPCRYL